MKLQKNPWITRSTKRKLQKRDKAWMKYRTFPTEANFNEYKYLRNKANKKVKDDQASYRKRILKSFKGKPKRFYGYMQKLRTVKDKVARLTAANGELTETDEEAAQTLENCFSNVFVQEVLLQVPTETECMEEQQHEGHALKIEINENVVRKKLLTLKEDKAQGPDDIHPAVLRNCADAIAKPLSIIFCKSLHEGALPQDWKLASVCPIFKKGDRSDAGNYRPVSLTSVPCKVLESIIKDAMTSHLEENGFYDNCQHGFVKGRSTLTNLLETVEAWTRLLEEGFGIDVVYLDYRKAFDTVPHQRLMKKIRGLGLSEEVTDWIKEFLHDRKMKVCVRGSCSEWIDVLSGVPQGSVLGPLLFLIFVQDLPDWIKNSIKMFADDTKIWAKIACLEDAESLQQDLERLVQWSEQWLLKFNPSKCKVMHIGHNLSTSYTLRDGIHTAALESTDKEKDLGIHITRDLKSEEQCVQSTKKARSVLGMVKRHFKVIDKEDFLLLYKTYIRPHLEYCVQVWSPHLKKDIECLERIQRKATKLVKGLKRKSYEERLKVLKLHSLQQRRLRGDLIETYKILTGRERVDSQLFFQLATDSHNLRGHSLKLFLPRCSTTARRTFFCTRVVNHWNSLPHHVIEAPSVNAFKNRLDKYWSDMGV